MAMKTTYAKRHPKLMMLQMFADDPDSGADEDSSGPDKDGDKGKEAGNKNGGSSGKDDGDKSGDEDLRRKYSDAEVDRIVAKHRANWEKEHAKEIEAAKDEARKYERMSKEQREEADRKKAAEEAAAKDKLIAELQQKIALDNLRKEVAADVENLPKGIVPSQDFLDLVVTPDANAEIAFENARKLVAVIEADRKAQEEKRARGTTPKSYSGNESSADPYQAIRDKYRKMKGK